MNSNKMAFTEHLIPANGRRESFWVLGVVAAIVATSALTLSANQASDHSIKSVDTRQLDLSQKQLLMELSNALPEVRFEHQETGQLPSPDSLAELGIAPFASELNPDWHWSRHADQCYLGTPIKEQRGHFLLLPSESHGGIYFSQHGNDLSQPCAPGQSWIRLDTEEDHHL